MHALGVILYEALADHALYDVNAKSLAFSIAQGEPALLSAHDRRLRGDGETIVQKALKKGRERRFQAAAELGAEFERYLRHEPISARPPSTVYVMRNFAPRSRSLVTGLAVAAINLTAGITGVMWQAWAAPTQRDRAPESERLAVDRRKDSEAAPHLPEDRRIDAEVKAAIALATSNFLGTMLNSAGPEVTMDQTVPMRVVLDHAAATADTGFKPQPAVEATVRMTLERRTKTSLIPRPRKSSINALVTFMVGALGPMAEKRWKPRLRWRKCRSMRDD